VEPVVHWDVAYAASDADRSWFQADPGTSPRLIAAAGANPAPLINVGGSGLLAHGFTDITVLDLPAAALKPSQARPSCWNTPPRRCMSPPSATPKISPGPCCAGPSPQILRQ
jgi:hypothetical protein